MSAGAVVAFERENTFVQRDGAPADRHRRFQHNPLSAEFEVRPVHDDQRSTGPRQERPGQRPIDVVAFAMKVLVAEQSIDGLDLVLDARNAGEASTQLRQRELATE